MCSKIRTQMTKKIDIEPKGLHQPKRKIPEELSPKKVRHSKPPPTKNNVFENISLWAEHVTREAAKDAAKKIIPEWVWYVISGAIILITIWIIL